MNICIQNGKIMSEEIPANKPVTIRFSDAENIRFWKIMGIAQRFGYANKSDILRELLGLSELKVLTKEDVKYFQTGEKVSAKTDRTKTHIVGRAIEMDVPEYDEEELKKIKEDKNELERNA